MQTAIITATGEQVEIVAVNGGWTTVHTLDAATREFKVRNGALSQHTTLSGQTAELAAKKAEIVRVYNADGTGPVDKIKQAKAAAQKVKAEPKDPSERKNGVVYAGYLPQYEKYKAVVNGAVRRSIDKGDALAVQLRGMELADVYRTAAELVGHSVADLKSRFEHLNPGMQRMSLGNMVRKVQKEAAQ
jgi:hypothetical protein